MSDISPSIVQKLRQAAHLLSEIGFVSGDGPFNEAVKGARGTVRDALDLAALRKQQSKEHLIWLARFREDDARKAAQS